MIALISVFAVVLLSLIVTRVAAVLLVLTGMSHEAARFQARSAFMGVGFTTSEAEAVTTHPQRRRIVAALMLLGSAGLVTVIASLIVSFGGTPRGDGLVRALALIGGLLLLYLVARSSWVDRRLEALVGDIMRAGGLSVRDYASLLDLEGDYAVAEKHVDAEDWMAGRTLGDLGLDREGISVLGVHRHRGGYLDSPPTASPLSTCTPIRATKSPDREPRPTDAPSRSALARAPRGRRSRRLWGRRFAAAGGQRGPRR